MESQTVNLSELSKEDKKKLMAELAAEEKQIKQKLKSDKVAYKELSVEFLLNNIDPLIERQNDMEQLVDTIFENFNDVLSLKKDIYGIDKLDQESHTVTHPDGSCSITIGHNITISFDGTETAGIQKIMNYLTALSGDENDENAVKLSKAVNQLLKPNVKTGMLNPSKIIQLNQMRSDFNSPEFDEGMDIITDAQNRTKGSTYVSGYKFVQVGENRTKKVEFRFTV
ncbi:DUF3164 family protein [Flavobacterium laiguense]|uniref:DUF3164 domain-containing protein n=1 Tax=Flavobacterium laiguense TaxID=2169409 RepID=A0A2U1K1S0_9FLAO|nr:hypothetical protein [Flavobacterium laiguense]PWA10943.1 hypothetical protein DB891_03690 [Flavobacterium laiguense]